MTHNAFADTYVTVLTGLQAFTAETDFSSRGAAERDLERRHAFDHASPSRCWGKRSPTQEARPLTPLDCPATEQTTQWPSSGGSSTSRRFSMGRPGLDLGSIDARTYGAESAA